MIEAGVNADCSDVGKVKYVTESEKKEEKKVSQRCVCGVCVCVSGVCVCVVCVCVCVCVE